MDALPQVAAWPALQTLSRVTLALAVGLFVGLEREWRGKEAGLRTFGFAALLGALGGLLGPAFALMSLALLGVLVGFLNWQSLRANQGAELTTSAALLVTGFTGIMCGLGHRVTPAAVAVVSAGLLAWKERLAGFSHRLTADELRSAILLSVLAFGIYPVLPDHAVDRWGLIAPRAVLVTVILIAAIGFANYVLWKIAGPRGMELTGFLGGLVNSTVTVTEVAARVRQTAGAVANVAYRSVILATLAMGLRNALLLGLLSLPALVRAALPLGLMLFGSVALVFLPLRRTGGQDSEAPSLPLESPFKISAVLKYGTLFVGLAVLGAAAQKLAGPAGFYVVSALGGLVSSASAVASGATLAAHGQVGPSVAAAGAVLASLASAAVNVVVVARISGNRQLSLRLAAGMTVVVTLGVLGAVLQDRLGFLGG
ncbi:MAG: MgtC/SapB family protein [Myxococcaceae bacterium]